MGRRKILQTMLWALGVAIDYPVHVGFCIALHGIETLLIGVIVMDV